ncbi:hypothetical protein D3C87_2011000 [compost metagenome]
MNDRLHYPLHKGKCQHRQEAKEQHPAHQRAEPPEIFDRIKKQKDSQQQTYREDHAFEQLILVIFLTVFLNA